MLSLYTRETLENLFKQKKPNVASRTITTYVNNILRIQRELGQPDENELEEWLNGFSATQARNIMTALQVLYDGKYKRLFSKYNIAANEQLDTQRITPSELKHWVSKKEVRKMLKRLSQDCETHKVFNSTADAKWRLRQSFVLWSVHWEFPWRNSLTRCKVVGSAAEMEEPEKANYYCIAEQSFYMAVFKTARVFKRKKSTFGFPLKHRVSPKLAQLLLKHIEGARAKEDSPLFCTRDGRALSKNAYSNALTGATKRYLAKRVGSTLWRHIYLTEWSANRPSLRERRAMATRFHQTSIETQMRYERPEVDV